MLLDDMYIYNLILMGEQLSSKLLSYNHILDGQKMSKK